MQFNSLLLVYCIVCVLLLLCCDYMLSECFLYNTIEGKYYLMWYNCNCMHFYIYCFGYCDIMCLFYGGIIVCCLNVTFVI